ncbi:lysylphosphatidylglycerol synthase transmembrane domain-containing protein [Ruegeria sp. R14_0]|uniref:lysylphosphatidylglycerol synthase transmembrane domain-containing protein n=1 Tax=Ruegeria sp. R14_0 TaxID=2821100 RepID=UPI001ADCB884|nr:lysylphosphatidylglycerol synthase transmembrane domain-containing protein [Ruegeria sp. R14_0]MBO9447413.1 flippase-like domain-containing protein [Ruegeria sp. R14_0]
MNRYLIRFGVSITVIIALLWWTDAARVADHLRMLRPEWLGLSIFATTCATLSMAYRWQITARALDIRFDYPFALREYYIAQLVNLVLPGGVPGDVTRAVRARKKAGLKRSAQSVVAERLLGQIAIMTILFLGVSAALIWPAGFDHPMLSMTVLAVMLFALIVLSLVSLALPSIGRLIIFLIRLQRQTAFVFVGLVSSACLILGFYASARSVGVIIPPGGLVTVVPLVLTAMLIPMSIGGWGWREGAAAALFPLIGASSSAGIASGVTYGAVILIAALPAAAILLWPKPSEPHPTTGKRNST